MNIVFENKGYAALYINSPHLKDYSLSGDFHTYRMSLNRDNAGTQIYNLRNNGYTIDEDELSEFIYDII
jgi:hypothetical protein